MRETSSIIDGSWFLSSFREHLCLRVRYVFVQASAACSVDAVRPAVVQCDNCVSVAWLVGRSLRLPAVSRAIGWFVVIRLIMGCSYSWTFS